MGKVEKEGGKKNVVICCCISERESQRMPLKTRWGGGHLGGSDGEGPNFGLGHNL